MLRILFPTPGKYSLNRLSRAVMPCLLAGWLTVSAAPVSAESSDWASADWASADWASADWASADWAPAVDPLMPAASGGVSLVDRSLAKLSAHRRLLMIAAHPDDEDTFVLAHVSAAGGEAAYLSLSRGDGGQNLIGAELGEGLGLLRSSELESARGVDGARQYFTRAYDFGYTRSLDETLERWPLDVLMADAREVVRRFKPQVLVAVFPSSARAGHGQHIASAVVAEKLFEELSGGRAEDGALIDSFYRASWWNPTAATVELDLGRVDPFTGRSVFQTALASRSRHRCQDMGFEQPPGDATAGLIRQGAGGADAEEVDAEEKGSDLFADSDTRLAALAAPMLELPQTADLAKQLADDLAWVEATARETRSRLVPTELSRSAQALGQIVDRLTTWEQRLRESESGASEKPAARIRWVRELVAEKLQMARDGYSAAAGLVVDAVTDRERLVAGETLDVRSLVWSSGDAAVTELEIDVLAGSSWALLESRPAEPTGGRFRVEVTDEQLHTIQIPSEASSSVPYFLRRPRQGDLYDWRGASTQARTLPFAAPPLRLRIRADVDGVPMEWVREVVHRYRDQALGEVRRPLRVVPAVEVAVDRDLVVRPLSQAADLTFEVTLRRHQKDPAEGRIVVLMPENWPRPEPISFQLSGSVGQEWTAEVSLDLPKDLMPGRYEIGVAIEATGQGTGEPGESLQPVEYEHIRPTVLPRRAVMTLVTADIELPDLRSVAYVRGASDRVPEMLQQIGLPVEVIRAEDLLSDLSRFDTLVIGSRAYEVDPALGRNNDRVLEFARRGGTVLVQYQQYQFARGGFTPYAFDIDRPHDRVTDETAGVRLLKPEHRVFKTPNRIDEKDWSHWVQERGLYFAGSWGPEWTPLLSMHDPIGDPGGDEKNGSLLVAEVGEGRYIYTGLAFFRQLPAGVVGAFRLFANLMADSAADPAGP